MFEQQPEIKFYIVVTAAPGLDFACPQTSVGTFTVQTLYSVEKVFYLLLSLATVQLS